MEKFKDLLKKHNRKVTSQRVAVHEVMLSLGHACADDVCSVLKKKSYVKITLATTYNILSDLSDINIYSRRLSYNNKMFFDVNSFNHAHLYDCQNHTYKDIADEGLVDVVTTYLKNRRFRGYSLDHVDVQVIVRPTRKPGKYNPDR